MNWDSSDRLEHLPVDWQDRRSFVAMRAGFQCEALLNNGQRCLTPGTDCDHIERGNDHSVNNLQWLCSWHHKRKTQREAKEALRDLRKSRSPKTSKHPGLIE